ncbi:MAG: AAA family ATPase [Eubacteriales bacterium]|nr:AAA family ATPase [Clostridiales bacterium]MDY5835637.1 AAA family ATPase [Eubacteriales bacterium]
MLTKISLEDVASYKSCTSLETDKKVNLIYGLNGTGKSTFSNYLYDLQRENNSINFSKCSIEGLHDDDSIFVYNQAFVKDFFYEANGIKGIFTLSKENKIARENIEAANKKISELKEQLHDIQNIRDSTQKEHTESSDQIKEKIWEIKTDYSGGDRVLEFCLEGLKSSKDKLFNHLSKVPIPEEPVAYDINDLIKDAGVLTNTQGQQPMVNRLDISVEDIENSPLLEKAIVGNKDSTVADLIDELGNSDWVRRGIGYIRMDGEVSVCPFCQQKTITKNLLKEITQYFDKSYEEDSLAVTRLVEEYVQKTKEIISFIDKLKENLFLKEMEAQLEIYEVQLKSVIEKNLSILREKQRNLSHCVTIESVNNYVKKINEIVDWLNQNVKEYNDFILNEEESKKTIKMKFWTLMRNQYARELNCYQDIVDEYKQNILSLNETIEELNQEIIQQTSIINENQKNTLNIDEAIDNINSRLFELGITGFKIEKYPNGEGLYRLNREDTTSDVFLSLSEGEKMLISFLYFIEMCNGQTDAGRVASNKIVVIDDPISSLSHIYIYNIGRLIYNEFFRTDKYEQIFILTHSLYFFYELTNLNPDKRSAEQRLFRIYKNQSGSHFCTMRYEEIQNDYQAYWYIVKDKNQPPALIANCMRNIIEYFFNFVEKQDFNNIFQREALQNNKFQAFNRYMNRESHSKGQNIFDIKEFDYDSFREAFRLVFEIEGYREHYNKMMK